MELEWLEIDGFPGYAICNDGTIINNRRDLEKTPYVNQQGIPSVLFMRNGEQCRRGIAKLVATHFLNTPPRDTFDTPINLDGNRMNNRADNLAWRPRWFAVQYHAQLKRPTRFRLNGQLHLLDTNEEYDDIRACAMQYGLLEKDIVLSAQNRTVVFPTWHSFQIIEA